MRTTPRRSSERLLADDKAFDDSTEADEGEPPDLDSVFGDLDMLLHDDPEELDADGELAALAVAEAASSSSGDDDIHRTAEQRSAGAPPSSSSIPLRRVRCRSKGPRSRMFDVDRLAVAPVAKRPSSSVAEPSAKVLRAEKSHRCRGVDGTACVFDVTSPGQPARFQTAGRCPWCCETNLREALARSNGRDMLGRSLRIFWAKDKDVFDAAVLRLPENERTFFPLRALGLPRCFESAAALTAALSTAGGRGHITRCLNRTEEDRCTAP